MVFGKRVLEENSKTHEDLSDQASDKGEEEDVAITDQSTKRTNVSQWRNKDLKPLLDEINLIGAADWQNPGGIKSWSCKYYKNHFKSSYTRIHYHFFGAPPGKQAGIKRCPTLLKDRATYEKVRRKVEEAEKSSAVCSSLKNSTISITKQKIARPIKGVFNMMGRDMVDLKVMRGLCANGIPFNVLRNPHFSEMVTAINKSPKSYKAPSFDKARTTLLDECKRDVEKDLAPIKDTWYTQGVSIVYDGWSNVKHQPLINVIAANSRGAMFMYANDFSGIEKTGHAIANYLLKAIEEIGP